MAGDLFDARQGKRVFPLITAGQVLGTTLGSFATRPITYAVGQDAALLVFGVVFLAISVYLWRSIHSFLGDPKPKTAAGRKEPEKKRITEVPRLMRQFPIVRFLIICGVIPNILLPIFSISSA